MDQNKSVKKLIGLVLASLLIIFLDGKKYFNWLKKPVAEIVQPLKHQIYLDKPDKDWQAKAEDCQRQAGVAEIDRAELMRLKEENEALKDLLESPLAPSWKFSMAKILSFDGETMVISAGEMNGIKKGEVLMAVIKQGVNNGVLLGRISQLRAYESTADLLSRKGTEIKVKTEKQALGKVVGAGGGKLSLTEVLQKDSLEKGDLIVTAGGDGWLPGLVVGRVGIVEREQTAVYQQASVDLLTGYDGLSEVFVVSSAD